MEEDLRNRLQEEKVICKVCKLVIPYVYKKGAQYTCPSFTIVEGETVCYRDYHPEDFAKTEN
jgi:hypothetical protein